MRHIILVIVFFSLVLSEAKGQEQIKRKWGVGIETGAALNWMDRFGPFNNQLYRKKIKPLFAGNIFLYYHVLPYVRIQTGIGYMGYGVTFFRRADGYVYNGSSARSQSVDFNESYKMDFIEIPLIVKLFSTPKRLTSPYLSLGISNGILTNAENKSSINEWEKLHFITSYCTRFVWNYQIGVGVEFFLYKKMSFGFETCFHSSLSPVFNSTMVKDYNNGYQDVYTNVVNRYHSIVFSAHFSRNF